MKYVFFPYNHYCFPLALQLKNEGHDVIIGMVENPVKELGAHKSTLAIEDKEAKKLRMSCCDGLLKKDSVSHVMDMMREVEDSEKDNYFFFFDDNDSFTIVEELLSLGFTKGLFPTSFYYRLENERQLGKDIVKKFFPKIKVAEAVTFKKVSDGIKHIEKNDDSVWVLKSNGNAGKTVVPKSDEPDIAMPLLIDTLNKYKKDYEVGGFTLEKKIINYLEVSPSIVFWNGKPIYAVAGFENKEFGAGNVGIQKGGNQIASVVTDIDCPLNKMAFPEMIYKLAKEQPGFAIYDAGLLYDGKDFYFTEFCGLRFGFDGIFSEMVLRDEGKPFVNDYFSDIMKGKSPVKHKVGVAVRLFNVEGNAEETNLPKSDLPIIVDESVKNNLFLYRVKKGEESYATVGGLDFFGSMAAAGETVKEAADKVYKMIELVDFEKIYYRPKFDFLSKDYHSSILNRIEAVKEYL